jgi:hypothetical protein
LLFTKAFIEVVFNIFHAVGATFRLDIYVLRANEENGSKKEFAHNTKKNALKICLLCSNNMILTTMANWTFLR